ncbi:MAG: hypothetical protein FOGNACKC_00076 [Anaerolineae bacterium]|nr:hypothetical protein [Anaerolineae bacterium]
MLQLILKHTQRLTGALSVLAVLIGLSGCFAAVTPAPEADMPSPQPTETTQSAAAATVESSAIASQTPTKTATVRPAAVSRTPTTATGGASTTTTPTKSATKPKGTPNATTSPAAKATPAAVSSKVTTGKVAQPLSPADGAVFTDMSGDIQIELKWSPVKPKLANNEYYVVTLQYQQFGQTWTDRAETKNTNWLVNEHSYLRGMADDGLFYWSVTLAQQTGTDANGVAIETPLSEPGPAWAFVWQTGSLSTSGTDKRSGNNNKSSGGSSGGGGGLPGYP